MHEEWCFVGEDENICIFVQFVKNQNKRTQNQLLLDFRIPMCYHVLICRGTPRSWEG